MRVTDLDKFSLEDIWRPYWNISQHTGASRPNTSPVDLDQTAELLKQDTQWAHCVLGRLREIGVYFPPYVQHDLVDVVNSAVN